MRENKRILILVSLCILFLVSFASADPFTPFTLTNGCWTATNDTYTLKMWNYSQIGCWTYTIPESATSVEYLVIGAGGPGSVPGGGGAGGVQTGILAVTPGTIVPVHVGFQGIPGRYTGITCVPGGNSTFSTIVADRGGCGANGGVPGRNGGSGGGGAQGFIGGAGKIGQGNNGGSDSTFTGGAGGGGFASIGLNTSTNVGGNGGQGFWSNITGTPTRFADGGGGAAVNTGTPGRGSITGGDACNTDGCTGGSAKLNSGSGGGGGTYPTTQGYGGQGSNGIVIIKYQTLSIDTTPPASITNLANTTTCENVTFTWTNPLNSDYSHLYNLFDDIQQTNRTNSTTQTSFTPAAGTHTFSTKTVDLSGNMNATWVNQSVVITACPTPTPTPTPSTTTTAPSTSCTLPTTPPWCAHQDIFFHGVWGDVPGYRIMNNLPERNDTKTLVSPSISSSTGEQTLATWLTPAFSSTESLSLAPGLWRFHVYGESTSDAGLTQFKYRVFNRSSTGTITWLFYGNAFSVDINRGVIPTNYETDYARRNYTTFFPGDRLGVQINVSTDSAAARTVSFDVAGNNNASAVTAGYFLCSSCSYGAATTIAPAESSPFVINPSTDKKTDLVALITDWWWLPVLVLICLWLLRRL